MCLCAVKQQQQQQTPSSPGKGQPHCFREAKITEIITLYNCGKQNSNSYACSGAWGSAEEHIPPLSNFLQAQCSDKSNH